MAGLQTGLCLLGSTQVAVDLVMVETATTTVLVMARCRRPPTAGQRRQGDLRPLGMRLRASQKAVVRARLVRPFQPTLGAAVEAARAVAVALEARSVLRNAWVNRPAFTDHLMPQDVASIDALREYSIDRSIAM